MDELKRLTTLREVERMLADANRALDARSLEGLSACYAREPLLVVNGTEHRGTAAVQAWLEMLCKTPGGRHVCTGVSVDLMDDGRARAITDLTVVRGGPGDWKVMFIGDYQDVLVREDGAWKYAEHRISLR